MKNLDKVIHYIYNNYFRKSSEKFSIYNLVLILYLIDWKYSIEYNSQLTEIKWKIENYDLQLSKESVRNLARTVSLLNNPVQALLVGSLSQKEKAIVDLVMESSHVKSLDELYRFVYSTFPFIAQNSSETAKLPELAQRYRDIKPLLASIS